MNCLACPTPFSVRIPRRRREMSAAADSAKTVAGSSTRSGWPLSLETFTRQLDTNTLTCIGKTRIGTRCRRLLSSLEKAEAAAELDIAKLHSRVDNKETARSHFENIISLCSCNHHSSEPMMSGVVDAWMNETQQQLERMRRPARPVSYREARESMKYPPTVEHSESSASPEAGERLAQRPVKLSCHHAAKRRSTDDECEICKEPLEDKKQNIKLVWCKGTCGRNFHVDCFAQWKVNLATARIPKAPECPYCRQPWTEVPCACDCKNGGPEQSEEDIKTLLNDARDIHSKIQALS